MSYASQDQMGGVSWASNGNLTAQQLSATTGDWAVMNVHMPLIVRRITFFVKTTVTCGTATPVITVFKRPTTGSTASQVSLGTLTIATTTAAGKVVYKDISAVRVDPGQDIAFALTTQGTDGSNAAGAGFCGYIAEFAPEYVTNTTNMVAST